MDAKKAFETFRSAILAGICISLGGFVFLACKGTQAIGGMNFISDTAGAVFFTFGLLAVIHYRFKLYTGVIGFIQNWSDFGETFIVLLGNVVGCLMVALLAKVSPMNLCATAEKVLSARLDAGILQCGLLSIGCGFVVTTAVQFGRQEKWLPLLFGVPLFIICGFPHCIADAFYYLAAPAAFLGEHALAVLGLWLCLVAGNFLGCNLTRIIIWKK